MYQQLSNRASLSQIEKEFNLPFLYPDLYSPTLVIDGSRESILPIITDNADSYIQFGIWGILPQEYQGSWKSFQKIEKTLHMTDTSLFLNNSNFLSYLKKQRCLIIVSGFFNYTILNEGLQSYYVHLPNNKPFSLAGIYSILNDGFITCSFLLTSVRQAYEEIPNMQKMMPLVIPAFKRKRWLDKKKSLDNIQALINNIESLDFSYYPISKKQREYSN